LDGVSGHAGWTYTYDAQNRLVSASSKGMSTNAVFYYDGRNRCVKRTLTMEGIIQLSPTKAFYYDGWSLLEERDDAYNVLARYYHGATVDELLARATPTGTVYYHQDALGSTVALTDGTGNVVESYRYDVYGCATVYDSSFNPQPSSLLGNRFLFTGREYLAELNLYDYRNRIYSPVLGRFLQPDPIRFEAEDVNLYRYVENNPVVRLDSDGRRGNGERICVRCYVHRCTTPKGCKFGCTVCRAKPCRLVRHHLDEQFLKCVQAVERSLNRLCATDNLPFYQQLCGNVRFCFAWYF
jgi:RHS repeat-associated protein